MVPRGLEPRTLRLLAVRSNQLSYETNVELVSKDLTSAEGIMQTKLWPLKCYHANQIVAQEILSGSTIAVLK